METLKRPIPRRQPDSESLRRGKIVLAWKAESTQICHSRVDFGGIWLLLHLLRLFNMQDVSVIPMPCLQSHYKITINLGQSDFTNAVMQSCELMIRCSVATK